MDGIHIDQLGYRPGDPKKAVLPENASGFQIARVSDGAVLFSGKASEPRFCAASLETVRMADFTAVTQPGEYRVMTEEGRSFPFRIGDAPYGGLRKAVLDFFRFQTCGVALDAGVWSHPACHTPPAHVLDAEGRKTGETKDVSGGWHDAGDYGRYIVPAAQTAAQLLLAYELAPEPDAEVLDIVWFEIEWMLKMQDGVTGGVHHKVSCETFNALDQMPDEENGELMLCPVSAAATADFAAAMALASRFYPARKELLLGAAARAWRWCLENPGAPGFKNPPNVKTGEYGDEDSRDERFWAACELFAATGDEAYHEYIKAAEISAGLGWREMGAYGLIAYLLHAGDRACADLAARMRNTLASAARDIMRLCEADPYGISLGTGYRWGSSMDLANNAMTLLLADLTGPQAGYRKAAREHIHYLLGKNALGKCYVSGFGSDPMKNPHHRPSVAAGRAVPGMVAGGPCGNTRADPVLHKHCAGSPPMKCYIDHIESCASNEVAIYWNAPVYFTLAVLGL
jgi:endoglucanase